MTRLVTLETSNCRRTTTDDIDYTKHHINVEEDKLIGTTINSKKYEIQLLFSNLQNELSLMKLQMHTQLCGLYFIKEMI